MKDIIQMDIETHSVTALIWTPEDKSESGDILMVNIWMRTEISERHCYNFTQAQENKALLILIVIKKLYKQLSLQFKA